MKEKIIRNKEKPVQRLRFIIQSLFAILCIWIGIEFYLFINYLESNGATVFYNRPPGVEGFLPISSMMSMYYFFLTGEIHYAHPAGFFIFAAIIIISFFLGKAFCSWLCPIGFISELIGDFGERIFKKKIRLPRFLDIPLRGLKYLLLAFFVYSIFFLMSQLAIKAFLDSPYNLVADIKMYYFFAGISRFSLIVISILVLLSIPIRNFWCRYLCPYGALLGLVSFLSPNKIKRNTVSCIDCGKCAKVCPSLINVDKVKTVLSDECTSCLNCIDVCPVDNTLDVKSIISRKKVHKKIIAFGVVTIFISITGLGILTGHWQNKINKKEYLIYYKNLNSYGHPTDTDATRKFNDEVKKNKTNQ